MGSRRHFHISSLCSDCAVLVRRTSLGILCLYAVFRHFPGRIPDICITQDCWTKRVFSRACAQNISGNFVFVFYISSLSRQNTRYICITQDCWTKRVFSHFQSARIKATSSDSFWLA